MDLQKNALDLGIVTSNEAAMLGFYRDALELPLVGEIPVAGVGVIRKLQCGDSAIKLLVLAKPLDGDTKNNGATGFAGATGFRYCTLTVRDLDAVVERCRAGGHRITVEIVSPRPGLRAAMVEDPDGNTVELMTLG